MFKFFRASEQVIANLSANQLCCHHYEDFNDPFECWCVELRTTPDPVTEPERYAKVRDTWLGPGNPGADDPVLMASFAEYVEALTSYPWSIVENAKNSARISCFSENGDNLLMWAHYGDGLRGFCVEFDEGELLRGEPREAALFTVKYQEAPEAFDLCVYEVAYDQMDWHEHQLAKARSKGEPLDEGFAETAAESRRLMREMYVKLLAAKPQEWHYEREMRLIFHSDAVDQHPVMFRYPAKAVKSITVGDRLSAKARIAIQGAMRKAGIDVPLRLAQRDPMSFRVNILP